MAWYDYCCLDCKAKAEAVKGAPLEGNELGEVIFETSHRMEPSAKELREAAKCPRCGSNNTEKQFNTSVICYIRGNGYLDKAGAHRDMNLHKLETDDPYADMREVGEVDDLKVRLKKAGQHNPRTRINHG